MLAQLHQAKIVITNYHAFKLREKLNIAKGNQPTQGNPQLLFLAAERHGPREEESDLLVLDEARKLAQKAELPQPIAL